MCDEEKVAEKLGPMGTNGPRRQLARGVLEDKINHVEQRLHALIALRNSIAWDALSSEVEESLWRYFSRRD